MAIEAQGHGQIAEGGTHLISLASKTIGNARHVHGVQLGCNVLDGFIEGTVVQATAQGNTPFLVGAADRYGACAFLNLCYVSDIDDVS